MRLTQKLTLAFVLVSLAAVGLAAAFVWGTTVFQFNQYLVDQQQQQFVTIVTEYYQANGKWSGVDVPLRQQGLLPPRPKPGEARPDPQPFALVDENGVVVIPGGRFDPGDTPRQSTLEKGTALKVNGIVVGTLLTDGNKATRNTLDEQYLNSVNRSLLVAGLGGVIIALLLGLLTARTLTHSLRDLTAATRQMAQGKLGQRVPVRSSDEIGELAASFNQMGVELEQANQSRRQMTADIAHDLRNPLTVLGGYLESLQDGKLKATPERLNTMQAEVQQLQHLVEDLRTLSLADAGELKLMRRPVAPADLLTHTASIFQHQAEQQGVNLQVNADKDMGEFALDPERMGQVLGNLVSNALRYTPANGHITLSAGVANGVLSLDVQDTGSGIEPEALPHIFERSYRADPSRSGSESGLGLAIARSIVELHGGSIRAESTPGMGARFVINLA